jgi:hypothetical protein
VPALSQRRIVVVKTGSRSSNGWCSMLSKHPEMSASRNHGLAPFCTAAEKIASIASIVHRPGRNP